MKFNIKLIGIIVLIASISCQQKQSEASKAFDDQMKETIEIHDDVMPKMSEINSLITELKSEKEKLEEDESADEDKVKLYEMSIANLEEAHDLMMSWMKNFSNTFSRTEINRGLESTDKDSIMAKREMLEAQYKSAKEMQKAITESAENAQSILSE